MANERLDSLQVVLICTALFDHLHIRRHLEGRRGELAVLRADDLAAAHAVEQELDEQLELLAECLRAPEATSYTLLRATTRDTIEDEA